MKIMVAAFGDAGHAFPAFGLGRELDRRGHEVLIESWEEWRGAVEGMGIRFAAAQEYTVYPPPGPEAPEARTPAGAALRLRPLLEEFQPDIVVSDILTQAPALAAELAGVPLATLIPHVFPEQQPGMPLFSMGFQPPRTPVGRLGWKATMPLIHAGLRHGRRDLNRTRTRVGLPEQERFHGGTSDRLALVATYPQLEYPREWPGHVKVTGPIFFELPHPDVELPPGDDPLVVIAPSTAHDPECDLLRTAMNAVADEPVRVLATTNRHKPPAPLRVPGNAVLEPWISYTQAMANADLVICHGGHGTVARSLAAGVPTLVCPVAGDMGENGARVSWSGAGAMLPRRLLSERGVRTAARRLLSDERYRRRAAEIAAWSAAHDGAATAAGLVEGLAR